MWLLNLHVMFFYCRPWISKPQSHFCRNKRFFIKVDAKKVKDVALLLMHKIQTTTQLCCFVCFLANRQSTLILVSIVFVRKLNICEIQVFCQKSCLRCIYHTIDNVYSETKTWGQIIFVVHCYYPQRPNCNVSVTK